jgi:hypothetical protein
MKKKLLAIGIIVMLLPITAVAAPGTCTGPKDIEEEQMATSEAEVATSELLDSLTLGEIIELLKGQISKRFPYPAQKRLMMKMIENGVDDMERFGLTSEQTLQEANNVLESKLGDGCLWCPGFFLLSFRPGLFEYGLGAPLIEIDLWELLNLTSSPFEIPVVLTVFLGGVHVAKYRLLSMNTFYQGVFGISLTIKVRNRAWLVCGVGLFGYYRICKGWYPISSSLSFLP